MTASTGKLTAFICVSQYAPYGHPLWRADKSTPLEWCYRIDRIPGRVGVVRQGGFATEAEASIAAQKQIEDLEFLEAVRR